jgi:hypothetical protein
MWIAKQVAKEIEALGAKTWLDLKDLRSGDEIRRAIKRGIRASNEAVVLLSANSVTSQWVSYEVGAADILGRRVTLVLNNIAAGAFAPMQGVKEVDLNAFDDFLLELAERIARKRAAARRGAS